MPKSPGEEKMSPGRAGRSTRWRTLRRMEHGQNNSGRTAGPTCRRLQPPGDLLSAPMAPPASLDQGTGSQQNFLSIVPESPVESRPAKARAAMILAGMARGRKGQAKVPPGPSGSRLCPSDRHGRPAASRGIHHRGTLESRGSAPGCSLSTSPPEFGSHSH